MTKTLRRLTFYMLAAFAISLLFLQAPSRAYGSEMNESQVVLTSEADSADLPQESVRKPVSFGEGFAAVFVLLLLWLWIAVFRKVKPYL